MSGREREKWFVLACFLTFLTSCCQYKWSRPVSLLSFRHPLWIDLNFLALQVLAIVLLGFNCGYLPFVYILIFSFSNLNNYNESYRVTAKQNKTSLFKLYLR